MTEEIPTLHGDGVSNDTAAIRALFAGGAVLWRGELLSGRLPRGVFLIDDVRCAQWDGNPEGGDGTAPSRSDDSPVGSEADDAL